MNKEVTNSPEQPNQAVNAAAPIIRTTTRKGFELLMEAAEKTSHGPRKAEARLLN